MSENLDRQKIGGHSENNLTVTSNLRYSNLNSYLAHEQNTHTKLIIIVNESHIDEGYLLQNIACPVMTGAFSRNVGKLFSEL